MDAVLNEAADGAGLHLDRVCDAAAGGVLGGLTQAPPPPAYHPRRRFPAGGSMLTQLTESPSKTGDSAMRGCLESEYSDGSPGGDSEEHVVSDAVNVLPQAPPQGSLGGGGIDGANQLQCEPSKACIIDEGKPHTLTQVLAPDSPSCTGGEPNILTQMPAEETADSSCAIGVLSQSEPLATFSRTARQEARSSVTDVPPLLRHEASLGSHNAAGTAQLVADLLQRQTRASWQQSNATLSSGAATCVGGPADDTGGASIEDPGAAYLQEGKGGWMQLVVHLLADADKK